MSDKINETVAILLPVYNAESTILRTLSSIEAQTYSNWKLYLVNDGSTDNTLKAIQTFLDPRLTLINIQKNSGLSVALNKGLSEISERYIFRIDADDEMVHDRIEKQLAMVDPLDNVGVYCGSLRINGVKIVTPSFSSTTQLFKLLCFSNPIAHPTVMFDKKYCPEINYKNTKCEDYLLWCELASRGVKFKSTKKALINYYVSKEQKSVVEAADIPELAAGIAYEYTEKKFPKFTKNLTKVGYTFRVDIRISTLVSIFFKSLLIGFFNDRQVERVFQMRLIARVIKKWI